MKKQDVKQLRALSTKELRVKFNEAAAQVAKMRVGMTTQELFQSKDYTRSIRMVKLLRQLVATSQVRPEKKGAFVNMSREERTIARVVMKGMNND